LRPDRILGAFVVKHKKLRYASTLGLDNEVYEDNNSLRKIKQFEKDKKLNMSRIDEFLQLCQSVSDAQSDEYSQNIETSEPPTHNRHFPFLFGGNRNRVLPSIERTSAQVVQL